MVYTFCYRSTLFSNITIITVFHGRQFALHEKKIHSKKPNSFKVNAYYTLYCFKCNN